MSFYAADPVSHKGLTNTWLTPLWVVNELGKFDLDPCGLLHHATAKKIIQLPQDGLSAKWSGRVWLNPPYGSHAKTWLERLRNHGNGTALVFARLETKWLAPFLEGGFFAMEGRIAFLKPDGSAGHNAGTGSILIPFGRYNIGKILCSNLKGRWYQ